MPHLEARRLLEERCLLEGGAYFNVIPKSAALIRGRSLFEDWHFLEKKRYLFLQKFLLKQKLKNFGSSIYC